MSSIPRRQSSQPWFMAIASKPITSLNRIRVNFQFQLCQLSTSTHVNFCFKYLAGRPHLSLSFSFHRRDSVYDSLSAQLTPWVIRARKPNQFQSNYKSRSTGWADKSPSSEVNLPNCHCTLSLLHSIQTHSLTHSHSSHFCPTSH